MRYRRATHDDVDAIAALHAESWRRHYRGVLDDAFLDGDVVADRRALWRDRFARPLPTYLTIVAEQAGVVVGFAHTVLDDDPTWGALVDNLHVAPHLKGQGVGTRLMAETARAVLGRSPTSGLYLWVFEQNTAAQAFYEARGGQRTGRDTYDPPGGGRAPVLRYAWPDASVLLDAG